MSLLFHIKYFLWKPLYCPSTTVFHSCLYRYSCMYYTHLSYKMASRYFLVLHCNHHVHSLHWSPFIMLELMMHHGADLLFRLERRDFKRRFRLTKPISILFLLSGSVMKRSYYWDYFYLSHFQSVVPKDFLRPPRGSQKCSGPPYGLQ